MLTADENETLTRVGPHTPMGNLLRRFWIPALESSELKPDGEPVRLTLLGERLLAFRDATGRVGLIDRLCAHRRADLFFARNEACGLRCIYHGWKYDVHGRCIDMPSEPEESNFKDKIRLLSYPLREQSGIVWAYMGGASELPGLPDFEWLRLPDSHVLSAWQLCEANFVQAIEGGLDSAHMNYLHTSIEAYSMGDHRDDERAATLGTADLASYTYYDRRPKVFSKETDYGLIVGAGRTIPDGRIYWRINQFWMPFYTSPPPLRDSANFVVIFVPLDDYNTARWAIRYRTDRAWNADEVDWSATRDINPEMRQPSRPHSSDLPTRHTSNFNYGNDYRIDRDKQKTVSFSGIGNSGAEDSCVQEGMGAIVDRRGEHLGTSDIGIIQMRRKLLHAVADLQNGTEPYSAAHPELYHVKSASVLLPPDADWLASAESVRAQTPAV